jgi:hypothetical protein
MIESTVSQRRELDSERQQKESEEQKLAREVRHTFKSIGVLPINSLELCCKARVYPVGALRNPQGVLLLRL